jgi:hypothetical protein
MATAPTQPARARADIAPNRRENPVSSLTYRAISRFDATLSSAPAAAS